MMGWASGVELTPEEEVETGPVTYLAFVALAVTNDLWSWEKEKRVTRQSGDSLPLINAIQMVMQMQDTAEESAKQIVCNIIREHEEQYCRLRDAYLQRPTTSLSVKKWFQVLELSMAGNALWSIHALRYHLDARNPYICPTEVPSVFKNLQVKRSEPESTKGDARLGSMDSIPYRQKQMLIKCVQAQVQQVPHTRFLKDWTKRYVSFPFKAKLIAAGSMETVRVYHLYALQGFPA
jgi:hypothetical protein